MQISEELQEFIREGESRGKTMARITEEAIAAGLIKKGQSLEKEAPKAEEPVKKTK